VNPFYNAVNIFTKAAVGIIPSVLAFFGKCTGTENEWIPPLLILIFLQTQLRCRRGTGM
jgi:hypothetical protein